MNRPVNRPIFFPIVSTFEQPNSGRGESVGASRAGPSARSGVRAQTPAVRICVRRAGNTLPADAFVNWRIAMTKAEAYRKRAVVLGKRMRSGQVQNRTPLGRKQKALTDMADNEDWLDGKTRAQPPR